MLRALKPSARNIRSPLSIVVAAVAAVTALADGAASLRSRT
jgi:hypothetical protein